MAENVPTIRFGAIEVPIKYLSLIVLVLQNSALVLFMKMSTGGIPKEERYFPSTAVICAEFMKMIACFVITMNERGSVGDTITHLYGEIFVKINDTMKLSVPAILYLVQNNVLFVAVANLDAATFQVSYQLKIITTAIFSVVMLGKRITCFKWSALVILMLGIACVQYTPSDAAKPADANQNFIVGITAVFSACVSSGFAGVYFEKILKGSSGTIWVRNIQLSIFSIICGFVGIGVFEYHKVAEKGFFFGYSNTVWFVIANQAFGGLVVAVVVKYADNILKSFATSVSIILSSVLSIYLFSWEPTANFILGAGMVMGAVYMYGLPDAPEGGAAGKKGPLPR
eukprot:Nk52_evm25s2309 gene=Nk52_evmTU25s2309